MNDPSRRDLLRMAAVGLGTLPVTGCVSNSNAGGTETTTTDSTTATTRDTTTTTRDTTTTQPTTDRTDDTKKDHVVVENRSGTEKVVEIEVSQEETLIAGRFRVPGVMGIRFDRGFPWETYEARARVAGGSWKERTWEPGSCANTPYPDGNQNLGAVVEDDGVELVVNGCDYLKLGETYVSGYEPAAEHRVESTTTTTSE